MQISKFKKAKSLRTLAILMGVISAAGMIAPASAAVPNPLVTGPIPATAAPGDPSHSYPFFASQFNLAGRGYVEEEYFIEGTANRYTISGQETATILDSGHPYKTRIVVRRPKSIKNFSGVVLVEWINVTNGADFENTWFQIHEYVLRSGHTWVGVSAQRVGVNALKAWNPIRYGDLNVEAPSNDALRFDIFSQAVQAIRNPAGIDPLGGLVPEVIIATGHSQSASNLATYANSIQPLAKVIDAFALHGSLGNVIRPDLEVPVWKVLSEFDVNFLEARVRRPDDQLFVTWEVTGTSHNDRESYGSRVFLQLRDLGTAGEFSLDCTHMPPGSAVPFHYVMAAGLDHLICWVKDGIPIPSAPPIEVESIGFPSVLARDEYGIALGGIRLAQVEVPIAVSSGTNSGPGSCSRWGYTEPFSEDLLDSLYPSHNAYVSQVYQVTQDNLKMGYILPPDANQTVQDAAQSFIGEDFQNGWEKICRDFHDGRKDRRGDYKNGREDRGGRESRKHQDR